MKFKLIELENLLLVDYFMNFDNTGTLDLVLAAAEWKSRVPIMKVR